MVLAAIGQICSTASVKHNLHQCIKLVQSASAAGAKVLFLPEASDYIASSPAESLSLARPVLESSFVLGLQEEAKRSKLAIHVGIHVPVAVEPAHAQSTANPVMPTVPADSNDNSNVQSKLLNRTIFITPDGSLDGAGEYDKLHLFDYAHLRESAHTQAGASLRPPFLTEVGRIGSLICFDLRFPEPSLALAQPGPQSAWRDRPAQVLTYPSAFTVPTGLAHWEVLLRARAIESQCFVVAAAQVGPHNEKRVSYGHSCIVDPWGRMLCQLKGANEDGSVEEGAIGQLGVVDLDLQTWEQVREKMPLARRRDVYL